MERVSIFNRVSTAYEMLRFSYVYDTHNNIVKNYIKIEC